MTSSHFWTLTALVFIASHTCWAQVDAGLELLDASAEAPANLDGGLQLTVAAQPDAGSKFEWAIFPVLAGNTDIGFEFGVFGVVTKLAPPGVKLPYEWSLGAQLAMSVNGKPGGGVELPVHDDYVRFDWR
jgi:hypothetical protein